MPDILQKHLVFPFDLTRTLGTRRSDERQNLAHARQMDSRCKSLIFASKHTSYDLRRQSDGSTKLSMQYLC
mgnify:CR=1 FL=1